MWNPFATLRYLRTPRCCGCGRRVPDSPDPYWRTVMYPVGGGWDERRYTLSKLGHAVLASRGYITRRDEVDACKAVRAARKAGTFGQPAECLLFA